MQRTLLSASHQHGQQARREQQAQQVQQAQRSQQALQGRCVQQAQQAKQLQPVQQVQQVRQANLVQQTQPTRAVDDGLRGVSTSTVHHLGLALQAPGQTSSYRADCVVPAGTIPGRMPSQVAQPVEPTMSSLTGSVFLDEAAGLRAKTYSRIGQPPPGSGTVEAYEPIMASALQGVFQVKNTFIELVNEPVAAEAIVVSAPGIQVALRSAPARYAGPLVTWPIGAFAEETDGLEDVDVQVNLAPKPISLGSALHDGAGQCRPCAWFWKPQGCASADQCKYCHLCPEGELKVRRRMKVAVLKCEAAVAADVEKEPGAPDEERQA